MSRWYRAYEGTVTDAKLAEAAMMAEVSRSVSIAAWHCLLESAAAKNNCGGFETSARRVAVILCEPLDRVEALFAAYREIGLVVDEAIASWKKRQFQSDDSKARVAKHRAEKRRKTATNQSGDADVTACNGDVTPPETETETDRSVAKATSPRPWLCPAGVDPQVWSDLLANRKRKRLGTSATAWKKFQADLVSMSAQTGIPPPALIEQCSAKGWGAIYDPRDNRNERPDNPTAIAVQRVIGAFGAHG